MNIKYLTVITILFLCCIFGFEETSYSLNKVSQNDISELKILKYLPKDNKTFFLSNTKSSKITNAIRTNFETTNQDELVLVKNSILAYLGVDLGTNKLEDIYNNELTITTYDNKEKEIDDILIIFKIKENKNIDDILNLPNKIDEPDKLIKIFRENKLNYLKYIYRTNDNYIITSSNKTLILDALQSINIDKNIEKKYISLRDTNQPFNPLKNYIRNFYEVPDIVVKNPRFTQEDGQDTTQIELGAGFFQSTKSFVTQELTQDGVTYDSIAPFIDNAEYPEGAVVYEKPIYGGTRPLEDDDEDGIFNYEDPDSLLTKNSYWRTGPNAKKLKKWKTGNGYEVGDLVYGNYNFVYKVIMAIPAWDASSLELGSASAIKSAAGSATMFVLSELPQEDGTVRFEEVSAEENGGFLSAVSKLDPTSFILEDVSTDNSVYWTEVVPTASPDAVSYTHLTLPTNREV